MRVMISLGAGVQSTTMALMAKEGEITPMPDGAIFADTGWEPKAVYDHLEKLIKVLPFPVYKVSCGVNIRDTIGSLNRRGTRFAAIPFFTQGGGMASRQCTRDYKITPIERKQRELLGLTGKRSPKEPVCEVWIGISWDERIRMKDPRNKWQRNRWPLIEKEMRRGQCLEWLAKRGWSAPKSACLGCPFHSDDEWRNIKQNPEDWADVVAADKALRASGPQKGMNDLQYMHRSCKPLDEVDLLSAEDRGQMSFLDECDGMCGV